MSQEEFYTRFLKNLKISQKWPGPYIFKFIIKDHENQTEEIKKIFLGMKAIFSSKKSSKKKFTSISVSLIMDSPESVINVYKQVSKLKGVISL